MEINKPKANFGTAPVFFTAISTILGAIMFLRFGYAVGSVGFVGTLGIIAFASLVTIPTAMAIAEIATNQKVEGGGEYYIISRSFGINVGASIGLALYLSQAISVAFYIIAFAEAFDPLLSYLSNTFDLPDIDKRIISLPAAIGLSILMLKKGADLGMKALYVVVGILFLSLLMFFVGTTEYQESLYSFDWSRKVRNPD
ncbi:MAG: amino acid permease, partial [Bacteroidota bacterium]